MTLITITRKPNLTIRCLLLIWTGLFLSSCSNSVRGEYCTMSDLVDVVYDFDARGELTISTEGFLSEGAATVIPYSVKKDRLLIGRKGGERQVFTILDNGNLDTGLLTLEPC